MAKVDNTDSATYLFWDLEKKKKKSLGLYFQVQIDKYFGRMNHLCQVLQFAKYG